jgi:hypothetical protein
LEDEMAKQRAVFSRDFRFLFGGTRRRRYVPHRTVSWEAHLEGGDLVPTGGIKGARAIIAAGWILDHHLNNGNGGRVAYITRYVIVDGEYIGNEDFDPGDTI